MGRFSLAAVIAILTGISASSFGAGFSYNDLVTIIQKKIAEHRPVQSLDEFLRLLPENFRSNFTLIYQSRGSLQDASPLYPRAIVFNEKMAMTFNGDPSQRGYDDLEVMEFDEKTRTFQLREIDFSDAKNSGPKYSQETPHKCLACHGADPKPIWNQYPNWPGIYGSEDDQPTLHEKDSFSLFIRSLKENSSSRYRALVFKKGSNVAPYQRSDKEDDFRFRPNLLLTEILNRQNALRLARIIEQNPLWPAFRDAALLVMLSGESSARCDEIASVNDVVNSLDKILSSLAMALGDKSGAYLNQQSKFFREFGLPAANFTMSRDEVDYYFSDGETSETELLLSALLQDASASDPQLRGLFSVEQAHFRDYYKSNSIYRVYDAFLSPIEKVDDRACTLLATRADILINAKTDFSVLSGPKDGPTFQELLAKAESARANPAIPVSCVFCHVVTGRGPSIPFDSEAKLSEKISAHNGKFFHKIVERTAVDAPDNKRMPPAANEDFPRLSPQESANLKAYLEKLLK